jgi:hypothetical protein
MFSLKRFLSKSDSTGLDANSSLSKNSNYIRTLEEDLAKPKSGEKEDSIESLSQQGTDFNFPQSTKIEKNYQSKTQLSTSEQNFSLPHFDSSQKESPDKTKTSELKDKMPSPFGSETFFQTQSPFDEKTNPLQKEQPPQKPNRSSRKLIATFSLFLIFVLLGGGVYYWWFFIKTPKKTTSSNLSETEKNQNQNLRHWTVDLKADKAANKLAIEKNIRDLTESASPGKIMEIKLFSSDNHQVISPQAFSEIFNFKFPMSISNILTNDYSLFISIENNEPRLGAAFKLTTTGGLSESLKNEEEEFFQDLKSFYLDKLPTNSQTIFSSSRYKNADIRYFNFLSPPNTSLDYTVISSNQNSYFIFSTSKNSLRAILDYMSEK